MAPALLSPRCCVLVVGALSGALVLCGCHPSSCRNDVVSGAPAPDGAHIAFIFHRQCPAAAASTEVSLIAFHASLRDAPGNVLRAPGVQPVKVTWRSPTEMIVSGFEVPTYEWKSPMDGVTIEFR